MTIVIQCCIFVLVINNNSIRHTMTTFNDIKTIANRANSVNRTPATDKQCAFLSSLINEKLNGSLQDAFGLNHGNMILTSAQASEMISDLLEMEAQAPISNEPSKKQEIYLVNENGEFLDCYANVTELEWADTYNRIDEAEDEISYFKREYNVTATIKLV